MSKKEKPLKRIKVNHIINSIGSISLNTAPTKIKPIGKDYSTGLYIVLDLKSKIRYHVSFELLIALNIDFDKYGNSVDEWYDALDLESKSQIKVIPPN